MPEINRLVWTDTVGAEAGSMLNNAELQAFYDTIQSVFDELPPDYYQSELVTPAYDANRFKQGSGATAWPVDEADVDYFNYVIAKGVMWLNFSLRETSASGGFDLFRVQIPDGYESVGRMFSPIAIARDNGSTVRAMASCSSFDPTFVWIQKIDISLWAASTNNTDIIGCVPIILAPK